MKKVFFIFRWFSVIALLIFLLVFTKDRQAIQKTSLYDISIKESTDNFIDKQIILDYLDSKLVDFNGVLITDFNKGRIEKILELHPSIKKVEVFA